MDKRCDMCHSFDQVNDVNAILIHSFIHSLRRKRDADNKDNINNTPAATTEAHTKKPFLFKWHFNKWFNLVLNTVSCALCSTEAHTHSCRKQHIRCCDRNGRIPHIFPLSENKNLFIDHHGLRCLFVYVRVEHVNRLCLILHPIIQFSSQLCDVIVNVLRKFSPNVFESLVLWQHFCTTADGVEHCMAFDCTRERRRN